MTKPHAAHDSLPQADDEAALLARCQGGDAAAYGGLVRLYQDRIYNLCWRMCGNQADAEDLAQEAFVKAFQSINRFDGRAKFYTWLFRITVNLVLSDRRKRKRAGTISLDAPNGDQTAKAADALDAGATSPDERASQCEQWNRVLQALASLDAEQRGIIALRDIESFGYEEIAEILEIPVGTVKSRLHRARLALRQNLGPILESA